MLEPAGRVGRGNAIFARDPDEVERTLTTARVDAILIDGGTPTGLEVGRLRRLARGAALVGAENGKEIGRRRGFDAILPRVTPARARDEIIRLAACLTRSRRKAADLARRLRHSEARFRDVIERNADAILVVDRLGVVQFANPVASELFGRSTSDLLGTEFGYPLVAGETTELDLVAEGKSVVVEMRVVESYWEGRPACVASMRDITERRRAEDDARCLIREQLARSAAEAAAARSRFLAESSSILSASLEQPAILASLGRLCTVDLADWAIVFGCEGEMRPLRVEAAASRPDRRVLEVRDRLADRPLPTSIERVIKEGETVVFSPAAAPSEHWLVESGPDSGLAAELRLIVPIVAHGRSLGALALGTQAMGRPGSAEISLAEDLASRAGLALENARLYSAAQKAIQDKSDYLAVISHDLRTPLNAIIGHSDLLSMGIPDPLSDQGRARVDRIRTSASHLLHLIDELIMLARYDSGHEELRIQVVDAGEVLREVHSVVDLLASEQGLALHLEAPSGDLLLRTDPDKLRQILLNLVGNAIKYTEEGSVRVQAAPSTEGVLFRITDTGIGIAPDHLDDIFKPFWQVNAARRTNGGGSGLGLSVVRRLTNLLGGEIRVQSVVDEGSVFTVLLPLEAPSGEEVAAR